MKEYKFAVDFSLTEGTFTVKAPNDESAYDEAIRIIKEALKELPVQVDFNVECVDYEGLDENVEKVLEAVNQALEEYTSDNVDVIYNEETGMLDVIYHSDSTSFPIVSGVVKADDIDLWELEPELDWLDVGYCW